MSRYRNPVVIHQSEPSISSRHTASSSGSCTSYDSSTPRSLSPSSDMSLRVFGAGVHSSAMKSNTKRVTVVNRNQAGYEIGAPTPGYGGGFSRRT